MKIQDLAIIFVIIILPISLALSTYTQFQIKTLNTQTLYDSQLTAATYDAIKAYQINAENEGRDSKDLQSSHIEASVATFKNSIMSSFRLNGYTEEELDNYIPALVYTMYDGFYIYSPYEDIANEDGEIISKGEYIYGLKPYINYSCRYIKGDIDVVITYALDNHITVQGMINNQYVNKSGYLIDGIEVNAGTVKYNNVEIGKETLKEYLPIPRATDNVRPEAYPYIKLNGTKYYKVDLDAGIPGDDAIIYLSNGTVILQCKKTDDANDDYSKYSKLIDNNNLAIQYYKEAKEFTDWLNSSELIYLQYKHAYESDGLTQIWAENDTKIFQDNKNNIENELSNFNQHRLAVIRHKIESNLAIAIANYNKYSHVINEFQMPELKEDEWDYITHNISLISFLQGLPITGKMYNGYTIVTNSESEEVVLESNIHFLGDDQTYHKIGDKGLETEGMSVQLHIGSYGDDAISAGRLNTDFKRKVMTNNNKSLYYYPIKDYDASYNSIVMQDNVTQYEDVYAYINDEKDAGNTALAQAFYTALGRERKGKYESGKMLNIDQLIEQGQQVTITISDAGYPNPDKTITLYDGDTYRILPPTDGSIGFTTPSGYSFKGYRTNMQSMNPDPDLAIGSLITVDGNSIIIKYGKRDERKLGTGNITLYAIFSR